MIAFVGGIIAGFAADRFVTGWLESSQLYIIGIPAHVGVGKITNITFITFGNGKTVSNASVTLNGAASNAGITDANGMLTLMVNATSDRNINITARKENYKNATSAMIATPGLVISATPASLTSNTASFVTFSVRSAGKPVGDAFVNISGAGVSLDGVTNTNRDIILQVNPPETGIISATALKTDYTEGSTTIASTGQQMLSVSSSHNAVTVNVPVYVTFTVTAGGSPVGDALVSLNGTAAGSGITNQNGQVVLPVNPTDTGGITATATKNGFFTGSMALGTSAQQSLEIIANPSNLTNGVTTYVTFTVTSGGSAVSGATVIVSGGGISTDGVTNSGGQVTMQLNAASSGNISVGTISVKTRKTGFVDGLTTIAY